KKCWLGARIIDTDDLVTLIEHGDEAFVSSLADFHNGASFRVPASLQFQDGKIKEVDGYWGVLPRNGEGMARVRESSINLSRSLHTRDPREEPSHAKRE